MIFKFLELLNESHPRVFQTITLLFFIAFKAAMSLTYFKAKEIRSEVTFSIKGRHLSDY